MEHTFETTVKTNTGTAEGVARWQQRLTGAAVMAFPVMMLAAFAAHPNLLSLQMVHAVEPWVAEWHGNDLLHAGHVLMLLTVPALIVAAQFMQRQVAGRAPWLAWIGGGLALVGAVFLAADKGALCLTASAFDTLPDAEFALLLPGLAAMKSFAGWMGLLWLLLLLPIGFMLLGVGLWRTRAIPRWQAGLIVVGSLLLANPDIEIISVAACVLLTVACAPWGWQVLRRAG